VRLSRAGDELGHPFEAPRTRASRGSFEIGEALEIPKAIVYGGYHLSSVTGVSR